MKTTSLVILAFLLGTAAAADVAPRTFESRLRLEVTAVFAGRRHESLGFTPGRPLRIPRCVSWYVTPQQGVTLGQVLEEIRAQKVPGLGLRGAGSGDLKQLSQAPWLRELVLRGDLKVTRSMLATLPRSLLALDLSECLLTDRMLSGLAGMTRLERLVLSEAVRISDEGISVLSGLSKLSDLDLEYCHRITDRGLAALARLPLRRLNLAACFELTDAGLASLPRRTLKLLDLRACPRITREAVGKLPFRCLVSTPRSKEVRWRTVRSRLTLDFEGTLPSGRPINLGKTASGPVQLPPALRISVWAEDIKDREIQEFAEVITRHRVTGLEIFELISDRSVVRLSKLSWLTYLNLSECYEVTDAAMKAVGRLAALEELELSGLHLSDAGLVPLLGLERLTRLDISGCRRITDKGLARLARLSTLKTLCVYECPMISAAAVTRLKARLPGCEIAAARIGAIQQLERTGRLPRALAGAGSWSMVPKLGELLQRTLDPERRGRRLVGIFTPAQQRRIDRLIADLGASKPTTREQASASLRKLGRPVAVQLLRRAVFSEEPEVARGARAVFDAICPGKTPLQPLEGKPIRGALLDRLYPHPEEDDGDGGNSDFSRFDSAILLALGGDRRHLPALLHVLLTSEPEIAVAAGFAIRSILRDPYPVEDRFWDAERWPRPKHLRPWKKLFANLGPADADQGPPMRWRPARPKQALRATVRYEVLGGLTEQTRYLAQGEATYRVLIRRGWLNRRFETLEHRVRNQPEWESRRLGGESEQGRTAAPGRPDGPDLCLGLLLGDCLPAGLYQPGQRVWLEDRQSRRLASMIHSGQAAGQQGTVLTFLGGDRFHLVARLEYADLGKRRTIALQGIIQVDPKQGLVTAYRLSGLMEISYNIQAGGPRRLTLRRLTARFSLRKPR